MKSKLFFFLCLLCAAFMASAQDYVIKLNGDTINGKILSRNSTLIKIKPASGKIIRLNPKEASQFVQSGAVFLSREVYFKPGNEQRFVGIEQSGAVNLLTIGGSTPTWSMNPGGGGGMMMAGGGRASYFVEKADTVTVLRETITAAFTGEKRLKEVREILMNVMGNDPDLAAKIQSTEYFSYKVVKRLVEEYNQRYASR